MTLKTHLLVAGLVSMSLYCSAAETWAVAGCEHMGICALKNGIIKIKLENSLMEDWGARSKPTALSKVKDGAIRVYEEKDVVFKGRRVKATPGELDLRTETQQLPDGSIRIRYLVHSDVPRHYGMPHDGRSGVKAEKGAKVCGVGPWLQPTVYFSGGTCRVDYASGKSDTLDLPMPSKWARADVTKLSLWNPDGETTTFAFDPAIMIHCDRGMFRMFVHQTASAGETVMQDIRMTLPEKPAFEPDNRWVDTSDWFAYENRNNYAPGSVIGVEGWLDKPAGIHGWLNDDTKDFVFEDGTQVDFFASNISWDDMACPKDEADQWNDRWAKYGVNLVRLHKFLNDRHRGIMLDADQMKPDPEKIKRFDYYHASAKKRGIYLGWSTVFGMTLSPADKERVRHFDEIRKADKGMRTYGVLTVAPDLQDLLIKRVIGLLTRTNTETGIRYADDPALAYIELQNEDDIFFTMLDNFAKIKKRFPLYYRDFQLRFNDFLREKYGNEDALKKEWGKLPRGQSLTANSLHPFYNWWGWRQQLTPYERDSLLFLYGEQHDFYGRFVKAIRDTGYGGAICGSCWQGWGWFGHLLNLYTDYEIGFIDRHNYSGMSWDRPGTGCISIGLQQEKNRPFSLSEWAMGPIGPPLVAFYGMGLQGWDAQCQFSSKSPTIHNKVSRDINSNCDDFIQVGQWPALSRSVLRGDVREGDIVANRRVSIPGMFAGDTGFIEKNKLLGPGANAKEFSAGVPIESLMVGRVTLEFIDAPVPENPITYSGEPYIDRKNKRVRSNTGQLLWDYSKRGYYTVDTPGTQGLVGHVKDQTLEFGDVTIRTPMNTELKLYVSALEKDRSIANAERVLITAFSRDADTGAMFDELSDRPLKAGKKPLLIEPVIATFTFKSRNVQSVIPLDHDGRMRANATSLKIAGGKTFTIDGNESKTMYYLLEMSK